MLCQTLKKYYKTIWIKIQKLGLNVLLVQKHSKVVGKQKTFMYCFNLFLFFTFFFFPAVTRARIADSQGHGKLILCCTLKRRFPKFCFTVTCSERFSFLLLTLFFFLRCEVL